jgi:lipopolysaccharide biosynthesis glycosyltransferase
MDPLPIFIGYDPREALAYHVCCQSIIDHATVPVAFIPLASHLLDDFDGQRDGTNAFIFSRFLVPWVQKWRGWALFIDGDMIVRDDVAKIFKLRDEHKAAMVVKHDYRTQFPRKYLWTPLENDNLDYPCKNWSSVILWNCAHYANRGLTPKKVAKAETKYLHRFGWIENDRLGELPAQWNWLEGEYAASSEARLIHHTLGLPGFARYADSDYADEWHRTLIDTLHLAGEDPLKMVARAKDRL